MSQPYVGELRLVGFNFAPVGWAICQGQLYAISEYETLFTLIGTTYGGDGQSTFGLPNLASRVPVHQGTLSGGGTYVIGQNAGVETVTITANQYPIHSHTAVGNANPGSTSNNPQGNVPASGQTIYGSRAPAERMASDLLSNSGGSQPHNNLQPFLVLNWIISLFGIYPSQS